MAVHACLKNEFTEDEKYHNLMSWLKFFKLCSVYGHQHLEQVIFQGITVGAHNSTAQLSIQPTDTGKETKKDNSHELVCADTSGIGSTQTSPRHSSRPSSSQSRNDSVTVQPLEDPDLDLVEVKKEQDDNSGMKSLGQNKKYVWFR